MENIWNFEILITQSIQSLGGWLAAPMKLISILGTEEFFILLMPIVLWCVDYGLGVRMGFMLLLSGHLNGIFKELFHFPRPYWYSSDVIPYAAETSYGLPSGHAMNTSSVFGTFAVGIRKGWIRWMVLVVILLVGFSRLYLGVHFTSDVLVGWLLGGLLVVLGMWAAPKLQQWLAGKSDPYRYLVVVLSAAILLLIAYLPSFAVPSWQMPAAWMENASRSGTPIEQYLLDLNGSFTTIGTWVGLGFGIIWFSRRGGMDTSGKSGQLIARFVIGLCGIVILWSGLGAIFPRQMDVLSLVLRLVRYALVGFWISALAPEFFIRVGLAKRKH